MIKKPHPQHREDTRTYAQQACSELETLKREAESLKKVLVSLPKISRRDNIIFKETLMMLQTDCLQTVDKLANNITHIGELLHTERDQWGEEIKREH